MTTYNYCLEMQELCFKVSQAAIALEDKELQDFYSAASDGFARRSQQISFEDASTPISQSQLERYLNLKEFSHKKDEEAARKLEKEAAEFVPTSKTTEQSYNEWEEMLDDNQQAEKQLEAYNGR